MHRSLTSVGVAVRIPYIDGQPDGSRFTTLVRLSVRYRWCFCSRHRYLRTVAREWWVATWRGCPRCYPPCRPSGWLCRSCPVTGVPSTVDSLETVRLIARPPFVPPYRGCTRIRTASAAGTWLVRAIIGTRGDLSLARTAHRAPPASGMPDTCTVMSSSRLPFVVLCCLEEGRDRVRLQRDRGAFVHPAAGADVAGL